MKLINSLWKPHLIPDECIKIYACIECLSRYYIVVDNICQTGFPDVSDSKESAHKVGDLCLIPGSGRSPGEGNGYPLHYSCLKNPMDRGAWQVL